MKNPTNELLQQISETLKAILAELRAKPAVGGVVAASRRDSTGGPGTEV